MFSDVRCGCIRCHVFQWMGIAGRMDRMGKTTFNRLPSRLCCGFCCFPMAGPKTHDIFRGFGGRRVMSLIKFSVSMSLRLHKAMARIPAGRQRTRKAIANVRFWTSSLNRCSSALSSITTYFR